MEQLFRMLCTGYKPLKQHLLNINCAS